MDEALLHYQSHAQCILTNTSDQLVLIARSIHKRIQERRARNFIIENDCSTVDTSFAYNINFFFAKLISKNLLIQSMLEIKNNILRNEISREIKVILLLTDFTLPKLEQKLYRARTQPCTHHLVLQRLKICQFCTQSYAEQLCWHASYTVGLPNQRNSYQSSPTFLCFENPTVSLASQHN